MIISKIIGSVSICFLKALRSNWLKRFPISISSMRQDVFRNLIALEEKIGATLKPEAKRFIERLIKTGKRNGQKTETIRGGFMNDTHFLLLSVYILSALISLN